MERSPHAEVAGSQELPEPREYAVVISKGASTYSATVRDLPGCAAVCRTREDVERVIQQAIAGHISGLRRQGRPVPPPRSYVIMVGAE